MAEEEEKKNTTSCIEEKTEALFQQFDGELIEIRLDKGVLDELISMCVVLINDRHDISRQATLYQRNRALLDLLIRRPYPTFLLLADALEASEPDNEDVKDLVQRMREHKEESYTELENQVLSASDFKRQATLQKNYRSIVCNLSLVTIIDHLVASNCLRNEEYESINALTTDDTKNRSIIDILSRKGKHAYNKFLEALRTDSMHKDLADKIEGSELTPLEIFRFSTGVKDRQTRKAIRRMGIPRNIYEKMEKKVNDWKEDDKLFINTKASAEVMKRTKEQSCVVITGNSGSGKTYIAHHTALMMKEEGYIIVPVDKPDEIRQYYKSGTKTIFVFDDMFGRFTLNQTLFDQWGSSLQSIESVLKVGHCKILATCRLQVFRDKQIPRKVKLLNEMECNICSELLSLDNKERKDFAQKYLKGYDDSHACLPSEFDFFPLICKLFKDKEFKDLQKCLNNPFQVIKEDIEALFIKDGKKTCCGLVLCVLFNNELTDDKLMSDEMLPYIQDVFEEFHLSRSESRDEVQSLLKQMEGVYISITEGKYRIIHDKLFDFLTSHFGNKMAPLFIKHSDPECIKDRFVWTGDKTLEDQEGMYIRVEEITTRQYHTRLKINLTNGYIRSALGNRNMKSEVFRKDFLRFLQEDTECQWVNKADNNEIGGTPLFQICFYNDSDFCKWLLDMGANVNMRRKDNATPLHVACQEGYVEIVKLLINHSADINLTTNEGVTSLQIACHKNRVDVVRELLQCEGIDINRADNNGETALFCACREGHTEIVKLLLQHSIDIGKSNKHGTTPLSTAFENEHIDVVTLLKQHICDM